MLCLCVQVMAIVVTGDIGIVVEDRPAASKSITDVIRVVAGELSVPVDFAILQQC